MVKLRWLKNYKDIKAGEIAESSKKSAENFVSQGYAEYVNEEFKEIESPKKEETIKPEPNFIKAGKEIELILDKPTEEQYQELYNLAKKYNCTYNKLNKILSDKLKAKKVVESSVEKVSVTSVTDVTDVTSVTDVTNGCVTRVTCDRDIANAVFGDSTFEQILKFLVLNQGNFTDDMLAKSLNKSEETIRQNLSRKKDYFERKKVNGKICHTFLSQIAVDEINDRISSHNNILAQKEEAEKKKKKQLEHQEKYNLSIQNFIRETNPKREGSFIYMDFNELAEYDPKLADTFLDDPTKFIESFSKNFDDLLEVQLLNLPKSLALNIEEIRKEQLNRVICLEGRITSFGEVRPVITEVTFECPSCGCSIVKKQNYRTGELTEPFNCLCGRKKGFFTKSRKEVNTCFIQLEDLQDKTDNPHSQRIKAVLFNGMCGKEKIKLFNPGNEIRAVGILKEVPIIKKGKQTVFLNWIFEIISAELIEKDIEISNISSEELEKINNLSKEIDKEGLMAIVPSFAPEVFGYDIIKQAIILQMVNKRNDKKCNAVRNKSNILLIGDPGVAKSVLGDFAVDILPGARKAVGGGSSAVGITASVIKEEESMGGYRVEPGAMILARDLLFIDELNNLQDEDKPKLQEGMNEMTISIDKANLHVKMKVSSGIIAAANPKNGHFVDNPEETIEQQFNIPTPILNRFDTIFVFRDFVDSEKDKGIATKMLNRHRGKLNPIYDKQFLRIFFSYIKKVEEPIIEEEIAIKLSEVYSAVRNSRADGVRINPRFLESMTRMIIASAKIRQSKKVEVKDIQTALEILSQSRYNIKDFIEVK